MSAHQPDMPKRPPASPAPPPPDNARDSSAFDPELEMFRNLMEPPSTFEDGFTWPAFIGALFVALVMVPGSIYMALIAGTDAGGAAQWVTLILFIEVARRANKVLKKSEIFTLFYLAGAIVGGAGGFNGGMALLWNQFYAQSNAAQATGIAEVIPHWYSPTDPAVLEQRSLFMWEWMPALGLVVFATILTRIDNMVLGYGLFRITSDVEHLPFPMAPLGAQGVLALSEEQEEESSERDMNKDPQKPSSWRWRVFSMGGLLGLVFGFIYIGLPTITGALLGTPISIIPIPFVDFTARTQGFLPAVATGLSLDLGLILVGMLLPFYAMLGTFIGLILVFVANPILQSRGILHTWNANDNMLTTFFKNNIDFYFSFSIGVSLAIAVIGIFAVTKGFIRLRQMRAQRRLRGLDADHSDATPPGRGDIKSKFILLSYLCTTSSYILLSGWLIDWHPGVMAVMLFYGFVYTPLISYVTARMEGIAGGVVNIPFVREAAFILCGYRGVAVWFLPIPMQNYGSMTVFYRQCELTGTSFKSIWKSELLLTPIIIGASILFAHFIWQLAPIPSAQYPFVQTIWEINAENNAIIHSLTLGSFGYAEQALRGDYIVWGLVLGSVMFGALKFMGAPIFLTYGIVRGLNQTLPYAVIPQFIGALIGRYYFQRKFGPAWRQYVPVVVAGFSCGVGLISTLGIGFTFLVKSVFQLPF
ncbi:MAG: hypothetical protein IT443_11680 [Phycisphaeraceae bacterium]|nr:hypothetical protein [Phycisphaeraceae bacterium]